MTNLVVFGTELEELDDEERDVISRRPLGVQEQVVRDEKGRRRFHGAFTGGFSAGYFNTVGTKEGWQPKQFRSSRDERGERFEQRAEDFMDEEDVGEFGIASRRMRTALDDTHQRTTEKLAWERTDHSALDASLASRIESLVRPVRESMGVRLLKKMGWREGQGIGPKMSRRALEKHKLNELRARGHVGNFNEEAVKEVEEMAPGFEFAPDDVLSHYLHSRDGVRGLGYEGLRSSDVLSERYGMQEASLKTKPKSKGIRGQAFGVGAFEDDDESIYTNYDLSQYDFAIGGNDASSTSTSYSYDSTFVMAEKRQGARSFFEPPRLPHNFRPIHRPILLEVSALPDAVKKFGERMTHVQRAKFLGEVDKNAVMELIRDEDRKRLSTIRLGSSTQQKKDFDENVFEEEPMKQARFKQYVQYLKRGLSFPQPLEMTSLEWDNELAEFQRILPPHLRSLLPEVKARQLPLANAELAIPIAQALKSKFTVASARGDKKKEMKDEDRLAAVRMKMFGEMTRQSHEWHPAKQLAKRFNVPDPYPSSTLVGVPHLQKAVKTETLLNLGSTADELQYRTEKRKQFEAVDEAKRNTTGIEVRGTPEESRNEKKEENIVEKPPEDFFKAIFADSDDESDLNDESGEEERKSLDDVNGKETIEEKKSESTTEQMKFVTVMDLVQSDNEEFGPAPPPPSSQPVLSKFSVIRHHRETKEKKRQKMEKKRKESEKKKKKEERRHKKHSKRRKHDRRSSSDS